MSKKKHAAGERPDPSSLDLPCTGVDSHAHLDMDDFNDDLDAVLARALASGVTAVGNVFLGPEAYARNAPRFADHDRVFFLLGIHPHDATTCDADSLTAMDHAFAADPRLKALGEIGLDYFYDRSPRPVQREAFRDQLALARERELSVVVHCRDAVDDTLAALLDMGFRDRPLLWHCFGGGPDLARTILGHGWRLSIPGPVSFPKSVELQAAVLEIPLDRMVLETDCPFLTPEPYRGKRNEPAYLAFTAQAVAALRGLPAADLWTACGDTARAFFRL